MPRPPRVFTLPPEASFLEALAAAVLAGFPREAATPPDPLAELPRWTILVPTRRAARELERIFISKLGPRGGLLPAIRPIGDIDEDLLSPDGSSPAEMPGIPDAISPIGRELALLSLIDEWDKINPRSALAQEIAGAPNQALALAQSLAEFIDTLETEEIDASQISGLYDFESARHREAVLEFLALARVRFPALLKSWKLSGPKERQSRVIRREARRLSEKPPSWPVIAAGSTGTIPATRELLRAIACCPQGAVILPGLDLELDDESWKAAGPQHPQFAMKQLLVSLAIERKDVVALAVAHDTPRGWLATEFMRPPEGSAAWLAALGNAEARQAASAGLTLIEAANREEEALAIALMLREALEEPDRTACLITPDRDLARRVRQELTRWNIDIDDTGGEPLVNFPGPALLALIVEAVESGFSAPALSALMNHRLVNIGFESPLARQAASLVGLALLRHGAGWPSLSRLSAALKRNRAEIEADRHAHPVFRQFEASNWEVAEGFLERLAAALAPFEAPESATLAGHLDGFVACLDALAGPALWADAAGTALHTLIETLRSNSDYAGNCSSARAMAVLRHRLRTEVFRPSRGQTPRLAIYGLLEARLMRADVHVLGGLNEGIWPSIPSTGPWLNRPMREKLLMQLPERAIGQTAHDLVQAMGASDVRLVWSRRIGDAPANPSRWVQRLNVLLPKDGGKDAPKWISWCRAMHRAGKTAPHEKPKPRPPIAARPDRLSVTDIEKLIRDPYALYAAKVLKLEPLREITAAPDYALRGTLYHEAIGGFLRNCRNGFPDGAAEKLLAIARGVFEPHFDVPLIQAFWWPRFQRIATWLVAENRDEIATTFAEVSAALTFDVMGKPFTLTCRADRIDVLKSGEAVIIDYKTGEPPSDPQVKEGLAPQLPLEAALLARGAFRDIGPMAVTKIAYVHITGRNPPGKIEEPKLGAPLADVANRHFANLCKLLTGYARIEQAYFPRNSPVKEDDGLPYDHLSRFREWRLSGGRE